MQDADPGGFSGVGQGAATVPCLKPSNSAYHFFGEGGCQGTYRTAAPSTLLHRTPCSVVTQPPAKIDPRKFFQARFPAFSTITLHLSLALPTVDHIPRPFATSRLRLKLSKPHPRLTTSLTSHSALGCLTPRTSSCPQAIIASDIVPIHRRLRTARSNICQYDSKPPTNAHPSDGTPIAQSYLTSHRGAACY